MSEQIHGSHRPPWSVYALVILYMLVFSVYTIGRHEHYNSTGWDLGIFTNLTWNAAQGRPMYNTVAEYNNMLAVHAPYITVLLAPLFWLWSDPRTLLIAQTVILAVGAIPIARLARRCLGPRAPWAPTLFTALWLLYPALGWINRWDFHEIAPAATFLAFAFEAADRRAWRQMSFWLFLSILCKEEIGLNVAFFGLFLLWYFRPARNSRLFWLCAFLFVGGIGWFVGHAFIVFPALRGAGNNLPIHAARYLWLFSGDWPANWAYLTGPDTLQKIAFVVKLLAPVAFVALLAPGALIVALPTLALSLLSSFQPQFDIYMHYTAPIIPAVMAASTYGLARTPRPRLTATVMVITTVAMWGIYNPLFTNPPSNYDIFGWDTGAHIDALNAAKALIPPDACVVTENNIQPHYSTRPETYVLGARGDMDGCAYMIVDLGDKRYDAFTVGAQVACYQFWSRKRIPIFFRDTVVVLRQAPAENNPDAAQQMQVYCDNFVNAWRKV